MSPDGSTFAIPGNPVHLSGPDILGVSRLIRVDNFDVFWTKEYLIARTAANIYSLKSLPSRKQLSTWNPPAKILVDGFFECGARALSLLRSDENDNRSPASVAVTKGHAASVTEGKKIIENVGAIERAKDGFLLSTIKVNEMNVSIVDELILLRGPNNRKANLSQFMFVNERFSLSKQMEYVVAFQSTC